VRIAAVSMKVVSIVFCIIRHHTTYSYSAIQVTDKSVPICRCPMFLCCQRSIKALQQCIIFDSHRAVTWSVACGNGQV